MRRIRIACHQIELMNELSEVPLQSIKDGSGHGGGRHGAGWIHGLALTRLAGNGYEYVLDHYPILNAEINRLKCETGLSYVRQVMVNRLDAGKTLDLHADGPPDDSRWHLPIITNSRVRWFDEVDGFVHMESGYWHGPVHYCGYLHSVENHGDEPRTHVVVDLVKPRA